MMCWWVHWQGGLVDGRFDLTGFAGLVLLSLVSSSGTHACRQSGWVDDDDGDDRWR